MRLFALACVGILALTLPAWSSSHEDVWLQYQQELERLGGDPGQLREYFISTPTVLVDRLDGDWAKVGITLQFIGPGPDAITEACLPESSPLTIRTTGEYSFEVSTPLARNRVYSTIYSTLGGNKFVVYTDVYDYIFANNFRADSEIDTTTLFSSLGLVNGTAMIGRPSADVLTIQLNGNPPEILIRCP